MAKIECDYQDVECANYLLAIRDALEIFSGKWKIPIIGALLFHQEAGFKELERAVEGITPKMLSKELKDLEMNLLITRTVLDTRPVTIKYAITPYGMSCKNVIQELFHWGTDHRQKIKESMVKKSETATKFQSEVHL